VNDAIEPSLVATVARLDELAAVEAVDWSAYRKCSQICRAETGQPCFSLNGKIMDGQPDGVLTPLSHPHKARKLRTGR
jgi:hypothetical protein